MSLHQDSPDSSKAMDQISEKAASQTSGDSAEEPTDGSSRPHRKELTLRTGLALVGGFFGAFLTGGFGNSFGVFQEYYSLHQLRSHSQFDIVWIASVQNFMMFAFAPLSGALFDKKGPFLPLCLGSICYLVAIFSISFCKEYYQFFLAQGLLMGFGMSFLAIPSLASVTRSFERHRGAATGFVFAGSSVGGVIWPIELNQLLNYDNVSFGWTIRALGFTMLPLCIIITLTVRPTPIVKAEDQKADGPAKKSNGFAIIKNPTYDLVAIGIFLLFFGFFAPLFFVSTYAVHIGLTESFSFYLPSIALSASFFGRIIPGIIADRVGAFNILFMSAAASAIIAFCWSAVHGTAGIVVWALAYGFASGSFLSLQATCAAKLATPETHGAAIGLMMALCAVAGLVGAPIAGLLVPKGYLALSMYCGAMLAGGSVFIALARFNLSRKLWAAV